MKQDGYIFKQSDLYFYKAMNKFYYYKYSSAIKNL
jgi:hypothetical protein